jgi:exoribonuclease-2
MGTKPAPHAGLGVAQYAWSTSPLRRYVDLVNQWQIMACARHGRTAALAAPFKPKDAALFSVISGFDAAYASYNDFQNGIERYWALRCVEQGALAHIDAAVMKDGLVRAVTLPLVFRLPGSETLPRGCLVRARVTGVDLLTLELHAALAARLDAPPATTPGVTSPQPAPQVEDEDEEDALADAASELHLAIDIGPEETPGDSDATPASAPTAYAP